MAMSVESSLFQRRNDGILNRVLSPSLNYWIINLINYYTDLDLPINLRIIFGNWYHIGPLSQWSWLISRFTFMNTWTIIGVYLDVPKGKYCRGYRKWLKHRWNIYKWWVKLEMKARPTATWSEERRIQYCKIINYL